MSDKLNCKPVSMAMVVRDCGDAQVRELLGRTMTVTSIAYIDPDVGTIWNLAEPIDYKDGETFSQCGDMVLMMIDNGQPDEVLVIDKELESVE